MMTGPCLLYSRKRTWLKPVGPIIKNVIWVDERYVRFTPKADMCAAPGDVCFGPKADINWRALHPQF